MRSVLDRLDREDVRLHQPRYLTLPLSVYEGTWTHSPRSLLSLQKRHIRDILGQTKKKCHTYDTSMTIIVTKPGIIIDVVGSYFYDKKS